MINNDVKTCIFAALIEANMKDEGCFVRVAIIIFSIILILFLVLRKYELEIQQFSKELF
jgi:hypothetical protein